jgi:hypothetical protein
MPLSWWNRTRRKELETERGRGCVGGERDAIDIADFHQRLDVRLVRMGSEWVSQKDHQVDHAAGD